MRARSGFGGYGSSGFGLTKDGNIYFIHKPGEGLRGMDAVGTSSFGNNY